MTYEPGNQSGDGFSFARLANEWSSTPLPRRIQAGAFVLAALLVLWCIASPVGRGAIEISITAPAAGEIQVYFDQGRGLSEDASQKVTFPAGSSTLTFITPPGTTHVFRIDPPADVDQLSIDRIAFQGSAPTRTAERYAGVVQMVSDVEMVPAETGAAHIFLIRPGATDPQIHFVPSAPVVSSSHNRVVLTRLCWGLVIGCVILILALQLGIRHGHIKLSVVALGMVLALSSFAITSPSVNPDEDLHEADARYFSSHWSPPRIDSAEMQATYVASPYGVSYLSEWNVTYLFAGKFGKLMSGLDVDDRTSYRLYQAALFGSLIGLILLLRLPVAASIPLILTPQVWYLFSYLNGDALPFAAAIVATAMTYAPSSRFRLFLAGAQHVDLRTILHLAIFVLCFSILIVSKRNYWPVAAFIAMGAAVVPLCLSFRVVTALSALMFTAIIGVAGGTALTETYGNAIAVAAGIVALGSACLLMHWAATWIKTGGSRTLALRFLSVFALTLAMVSPWMIQDYLKNGSGAEKHALVESIREIYAAPEFKPSSTSPAPGLKMREQGYSLRQLVEPPLDWHVATFKSLFGVYGYMQYYAADSYYWLIGGAIALLMLLGIGSTLLMDPHGRSYLVLAAGCALSLVGASLLHSWTYDFQAQGRYVMGLIVLAMPFFFQLRATPRIYLASNILIATIFLLGCYSFIRVAMPALIA